MISNIVYLNSFVHTSTSVVGATVATMVVNATTRTEVIAVIVLALVMKETYVTRVGKLLCTNQFGNLHVIINFIKSH